jgi:hypothetical protein
MGLLGSGEGYVSYLMTRVRLEEFDISRPDRISRTHDWTATAISRWTGTRRLSLR